MNEQIIYFDNNATTPLDKRVLDAMLPFFIDSFGNSSSMHILGRTAQIAVDKARMSIGELINSNPEDIVFTSGATEAINLALRGILKIRENSCPHIITISSEHPAVIDTCKELERNGCEITYLPIRTDGLLDLDVLKNAFKANTILVSVMWVNNETGIIQPIRQIAEISHEYGALFMTDATQAVGKIEIDVIEDEVDLLAFSGHKFYGPKGIGGLYINPALKLRPYVFGGGQERGIRSGTLNVSGIVGIGTAADLARQQMIEDSLKVGAITEYLKESLLNISGTRLNGSDKHRLYNTINICFDGLDSDAFILNLDKICVSNGSACHSMTMEVSHVLKEMGLTKQDANSSIRFSLGRFNTKEEVNEAIYTIKTVIKHLRELSTQL